MPCMKQSAREKVHTIYVGNEKAQETVSFLMKKFAKSASIRYDV